MPLPHPSGDESQSEWMDRCMANANMQSDYPRQDQRVAVCMSLWRDNRKTTHESDEKTILSRIIAYLKGVR